MINKILEHFGLMRVSRAKNVFINLVALHQRFIMSEANKDFGAIAKKDFEQEIKDWAVVAWEQALSDKSERYWYLSENEAKIQGYLD